MKIGIRRAFTLLELLIVVVILVIILTALTWRPAKPSTYGQTASNIVLQTGNAQFKINSGDVVAIDDKMCLVIVFHKDGENDDRVNVWQKGDKEPTPFLAKEFKEKMGGKSITAADPNSPEYKELKATVSKE